MRCMSSSRTVARFALDVLPVWGQLRIDEATGLIEAERVATNTVGIEALVHSFQGRISFGMVALFPNRIGGLMAVTTCLSAGIRG